MLPGIRFLCAAVVLAVSLVIFGMGAAALLRSAHEEFASLPNRRQPPATVFSRQPDVAPTLAMLRLEPRDDVHPSTAAPVLPAAAPISEAAITAPTANEVTPEPVAVSAATAIEQPRSEAETATAPAAPVPEAPSEPSIVIAAAPAAVPEPPAAAPEPAPETTASISLPTAPIMDLPTATLTAEDTQLSSSKVAVLGGPPIDTEPVPLPNSRPTAEPAKAKPAKKVVKKPAVKKRRVAARVAPAAAPVAQQQQDPFGLTQLR